MNPRNSNIARALPAVADGEENAGVPGGLRSLVPGTPPQARQRAAQGVRYALTACWTP